MSEFTILTLVGRFRGATGGTLYATLAGGPLRNAALGLIEADTTFTAPLGIDGSFSLPLAANDDIGSPAGTGWKLEARLTPNGTYSGTIQLLRAGGTSQNLAGLDDAARLVPLVSYVPLGQKGIANGVATLDSAGLVPAGQLPVAGGAEPTLGLPATDGRLLSSSAAGLRSWITPSASPVQSVNTLVGAVTLDDTNIQVQDPTAGGIVHTLRVTLAALLAVIATKIGNPLTTLGDLFTGGAAGGPSRLPIGGAAQVLTVVGGVPAWAAAGGGADPRVTGTGSLALGTYALTVAGPGTVAVVGTDNTFTASQTLNGGAYIHRGMGVALSIQLDSADSAYAVDIVSYGSINNSPRLVERIWGATYGGSTSDGYGVAQRIALDSSTNQNQTAGQSTTRWLTASHATRRSQWSYAVVDQAVAAGALSDVIAADTGGGSNTTGLWLWDANSSTLKRVLVGAADSAGTGYRTLRIAN